MTFMRAGVGVVFAAVLSASLLAQGPRRDGNWEITMTMDMPGMPQGMSMPPIKTTQCITKQDASDPHFPYADGCISSPEGQFAGLDLGDATLGLPMAALAGTDHHDVMTYAPNQWISPYTYKAILQRLIEEDAL